MKKKIWIILSISLIVILCTICLVTCGSKEKKGETAKEQGKKETQEYYVDEETGEIIDAKTGEVVQDKNLIVDAKTGQIIDTSDKKANTNTENKTSNTNNENKKPTGTTTTNKKLPTSTRTVSFNKQRLYNRMISLYKKPVLQLMPKKSRLEFAHGLKGTIPSQIQHIFDWYFGIVDGKGETTLNTTEENMNLFVSTAPNVLYINVAFSYIENGDGTVVLTTTKAKVDEYVDQCYAQYASQIDSNNANIQAAYDAEMKTYNEKVAHINNVCNLVENAANKANIKGKDEVTAVTNIINYICNNCEYWTWAAEQSDPLGESIQDCLGDKRAVCNGYAKTFYAMCYYAGIDVTYCKGKTDKGVNHAWDSVNIGGTQYYFDVSWHDMIKSSGATNDAYIWAPYSSFSKDHIQSGTTIDSW